MHLDLGIMTPLWILWFDSCDLKDPREEPLTSLISVSLSLLLYGSLFTPQSYTTEDKARYSEGFKGLGKWK